VSGGGPAVSPFERANIAAPKVKRDATEADVRRPATDGVAVLCLPAVV